MSARKAQVTVTFEGATEPTTITIKPVGLVAAERRWGGSAFKERPIEAALFGAFVSVGMPGGEGGFDGWMATIEEIDTEAATADAVDPPLATPPDPSPASQ